MRGVVREDFLEEGTDPLTDEEKLASFCRKGRRQFYWPGKFKGVNTFLERDSGERLRGGTGGTRVGVWTSPSERRARERNASDVVRSPL